VEPDSSPSKSEAMLRHRLPLLILSDIAILGSVVVVGFSVQDHWNGIYLVWGIGVGVLGAANQLLMVHVLPKIVGATQAQTGRYRRSKLRRRLAMMSMITLGISWGAFSAIFDTVWFVLIFTVLVVLSGTAPYLAAALLVRRVRKRRAG
jgi:hypothetical protein